jgi:hypothetical protein
VHVAAIVHDTDRKLGTADVEREDRPGARRVVTGEGGCCADR